MTDELHHRRWTDERLTEKFQNIDKDLQGSRAQCEKATSALKSDFDEKHRSNQADIAELKSGQNGMRTTLNEINAKQGLVLQLVKQIVGEDGEPGKGRLGLAEIDIEHLQKFRWQALAIVSTAMALLEIWRSIK